MLESAFLQVFHCIHQDSGMKWNAAPSQDEKSLLQCKKKLNNLK